MNKYKPEDKDTKETRKEAMAAAKAAGEPNLLVSPLWCSSTASNTGHL